MIYPSSTYRVEVSDPSTLLTAPALEELAGRMFPLVFRTDLSQPGFCALDLGTDLTPRTFREILLALGHAWQTMRWYAPDLELQFRLVGRFDQKVTTQPHRDGGPDESILILGYEPTEVESRLFLIDYVACAESQALSSREMLDRIHPKVQIPLSTLEPFTTEVTPFDRSRYNVVAINNSANELGDPERTLGVLHQAIMGTAPPGGERWVSSLQLAALPVSEEKVDLRPFLVDGSPVTA